MGFFFGGFGSHAKRHFAKTDSLSDAFFQDYVNFPSITGFSTTIDSGAITPYGNGVKLLTGAGANDDVIIATTHQYMYRAGLELSCDFAVFKVDVTNATQHLVCVNGVLTTIPVAASDKYWGFRIVDGDLYGINSNGTTETATDLSVAFGAGTANTSLRALVTATTVKFFYNGVLKATHTTNHPGIVLAYHPHLMVRTTTTAAKQLISGRIAYMAKG